MKETSNFPSFGTRDSSRGLGDSSCTGAEGSQTTTFSFILSPGKSLSCYEIPSRTMAKLDPNPQISVDMDSLTGNNLPSATPSISSVSCNHLGRSDVVPRAPPSRAAPITKPTYHQYFAHTPSSFKNKIWLTIQNGNVR